jgi:hypothetical protein
MLTDGTGSNIRQKVNTRNQAEIRSTNISEEHEVSNSDGRSFFANSADTANTLTTATGNTYSILFIKNTSASRNLVIEKVLSSADTAGGVIVWRKNMTEGSIGDNNTHTPVNLNFSSALSAEATVYNWDETGTSGITGLTGGTVVKTFITGVGFTVHPIDGAIVLGQGNSLTVQYINGTGGDVEFECGIRFYYTTV